MIQLYLSSHSANMKFKAKFTTMEELLLSLISLLLGLFILILIRNCLRARPHDPNLPPGPTPLPIIGHLHLLLGNVPQRALHSLAQTHGPLMRLRLGQVDVVVASSPDAARDVLKTHDLHFASRPAMAALKDILYGPSDIAFAPYGPYWRHVRKIFILEVLTAKRVASYYSHRHEEILKLISDIKAHPIVNLSSKVADLTNAITARSAFGRRCELFRRFLAILKPVTVLSAGFGIADLFPSVKYIDVVTGMKFRAARLHRRMDAILEEILEKHRILKRSKLDEEEQDLVDVLLRIKDSGDLEFPLTDGNIKAVIIDLFFGGTDTSSRVIEWAMAELIKNPHCLDKAQSELRRVLEGKASVGDEDVKDLHYFNLVIREVLRLHPPLPLLVPRQCTETCRVHGYKVEAGTRIIVNAWAVARDPRYWKDPEVFDPERFDGSPIDYRGASYEYLPFGSGRRICPGMVFGLATVRLTLASLLFYLNWELPGGMKPEELDMTEGHGLTASRESELCLVATPYAP